MEQNIEIEFKNTLTKSEYEILLREFAISESHIFSQENHYFDTAAFALKENGAALRIRQKKESMEMTLKQPASVGLLETNQALSLDAAQKAIQENKLPGGPIQDIIEKMGIPFHNIVYFGSLITKRAEVDYQQGVLVLDHSLYLEHEDYELEYEVNDFQQGKEVFIALLNRFSIPVRAAENKVKRFYSRKFSGRQ